MKKRTAGFVKVIPKECKDRIANRQCPNCGKHKDLWIRRKDWACCSENCTREYESKVLVRSWPDLRRKAFVRDNFTCKMCNCTKMKEIKYDCFYGSFEKFKEYIERFPYSYPVKEWTQDSVIVFDDSELIGDHIKPICLGGDEWDINNIQTLCKDCNKVKTAFDMKEIAKQRLIEKKLRINSKLEVSQ